MRLKGGDPFVFGRGGEEALALRAAGGLRDRPGHFERRGSGRALQESRSRIAASRRRFSWSGHDDEAFSAVVDGVSPGTVTLVILMGAGRRVALARKLLDIGWTAGTPAAVVASASMPAEQVWRGTIADIAGDHVPDTADAPAVIIVGDVAALALNHEEKPVVVEDSRKASGGG